MSNQNEQMTVIFVDNPFGQELRFSATRVKLQSAVEDEICILPNFFNSIFPVKKCVVEVNENVDGETKKIQLLSSAVARFENNKLTITGTFKEC